MTAETCAKLEPEDGEEGLEFEIRLDRRVTLIMQFYDAMFIIHFPCDVGRLKPHSPVKLAQKRVETQDKFQ